MIKPLSNWVLIEELPVPEISDGGVVYPQNYYRSIQAAMPYRVLSAGPKADPVLKPGSRAILDKFRCMAKNQAAEKLWLVQDSSIAIVIPTQ